MTNQAVEDVYPLTPMQMGILYDSLADKEPGLYVEQIQGTLRGRLDVPGFHRAWERCAERHTILRTAFPWSALEKPRQVVLARSTIPVRIEAGEPDTLHAWAAEDARACADVSRPPLMRVSIVTVSPTEHRFVWTYHHLLLDGWSAAVVLDEVSRLYDSIVTGCDSALADPVPFRAYATRIIAADPASPAYWRERTAVAAQARALPAPARPQQPDWIEFATQLPPERAQALASACACQRLTLHAALVGAWALALSRVTGSTRVSLGMVLSDRPLEHAARLVGLCIAMVPVVVDVRSSLPLAARLAAIQDDQAEARRHGAVPLARIQAEAGGTPLFDNAVVLEQFPAPQTPARSLLQVEEVHYRTRPGYGAMLLARAGSGLQLRVIVRTDRVAEAAASSLLEETVRTLGALIDAPHAHLHHAQPRVAPPASRATPVVDLIEETARRVPHRIAIACGNEQVTYRELLRRAGCVAGTLAARGIGAESLVAVLLARGPALIAAMLGIWRLRAAVLPLDPAEPPERLAALLDASSPQVILVDETTELLAGGTVPRTRVADLPAPPRRPACDRVTAYVLFTSGTTGRPKGVMIEQRGLDLQIHGKLALTGLREDDVVLQLAPCTFDVSLWEMLGPLVVGARIVVATDSLRRDALALERLMSLAQVTVAQMVPSFSENWLAATEGSGNVRLLVSCGEALPARVAARWRERHPGSSILNVFAPTECADAASAKAIAADQPLPAEQVVPIGRPVAGVSAEVLDPALDPAPAGGCGDLWIAGGALARGYLGRPGMTAAVFAPDVIGAGVGGRMYRTGDLATRDPQGDLAWLGRSDRQRKVRGVRIELGEVESAIGSHALVAGVSVVAIPQLVAVIAARGPVEESALAAHVARFLPAAVRPARWCFVPELPVTPRGKLDRAAVERIARVQLPRTGVVASEDLLLESVASAVAGVLDIPSVGPADDFFGAGGDSLRLMLLKARIQRAHGVELTFAQLLAASTPAGIVAAIRAAGQRPQQEMAITIGRRARHRLTRQQSQFWRAIAGELPTPRMQVPVVVRLNGPVDPDRLARSALAVASAHEALRSRIEIVDEEVWTVVDERAMIDYALVDLTHLDERVRERQALHLMALEAMRPRDPRIHTTLRGLLYRLAPEDHLLQVLASHVFCDGTSMQIVADDLVAAYASSGEPLLPAAARVQLGDVSDWEAGAEWQARHKADLAWWAARVRPAGAFRPAGRRDGPAAEVHQQRRIGWMNARSAELLALARREATTPYVVVASSILAFLHAWSGAEDIPVTTVLGARTRPELARVVAPMTVTAILSTAVTSTTRFRELIRHVQRALFAASDHQCVTSAEVLTSLGITPEEAKAYSPVMLIYQRIGSARGPMRDVKIEPVGDADWTWPTRRVIGSPFYELGFDVSHVGNALEGFLSYDPNRYDNALTHYATELWSAMMERLLRDPELSIADAIPSV